MIERTLVNQRLREFRIQEYITENLRHVGHSHTKVQRTPLGEKIIIYASRPGLIVGRKGQNIKNLTQVLKKRFSLENPEIEIQEVVGSNRKVRLNDFAFFRDLKCRNIALKGVRMHRPYGDDKIHRPVPLGATHGG